MSAEKTIYCDCGYGDCGVYIHAPDCPAMSFDPFDFVGTRVDKVVIDEVEHFFVCQSCGQAVDMRVLGEVLHHEDPGHEARRLQ